MAKGQEANPVSVPRVRGYTARKTTAQPGKTRLSQITRDGASQDKRGSCCSSACESNHPRKLV